MKTFALILSIVAFLLSIVNYLIITREEKKLKKRMKELKDHESNNR